MGNSFTLCNNIDHQLRIPKIMLSKMLARLMKTHFLLLSQTCWLWQLEAEADAGVIVIAGKVDEWYSLWWWMFGADGHFGIGWRMSKSSSSQPDLHNIFLRLFFHLVLVALITYDHNQDFQKHPWLDCKENVGGGQFLW